jgi:hypothetical protein
MASPVRCCQPQRWPHQRPKPSPRSCRCRRGSRVVPTGPRRAARAQRQRQPRPRNPPRRPRQSPRVPLSDLRQPPPAAVLMRGGAAPLAESGSPRPLSIGTAGAPPLAVPDRTPRFPGAGLHRRMQATAAPALPQWRSAGPGQRHAMLLPLPSRRWGTRPSASIPALQASAPADPSDRHQPGRTGTAPRPVQCQPLGEPGPLAAGCRHSAVAGGRVVERLRLRPTPGWLVAPLSAVLPADHRAGAAAA